jgi:uncharacterized membrane protein YdfJ with MMPL/SSD domain
VSTLPDRSISKQGFLALSRDFAGGLVDPVHVVIDGPVRTLAVAL